jgi:hypothetical protein
LNAVPSRTPQQQPSNYEKARHDDGRQDDLIVELGSAVVLIHGTSLVPRSVAGERAD